MSQHAGTPTIIENDANMSMEDYQTSSTIQSTSSVIQGSDNPKPTGLNYVDTLITNMDEFEEVNRWCRRNRKNNHNKPPVKSVVGNSKIGASFDG